MKNDKKDVLVFVNIIAPYNIPLFTKISCLLDRNVLFVFDQAKESNRSWKVQENDLRFDYSIEGSFHINHSSKVSNGTSLQRTIYFPFFIFKKIWYHKPKVVLSIEFGLRTLFSLFMSKLIGAKLYVISDVTPITEANTGFLKKNIRRFIAYSLDGAIARSYNAKTYLQSIGLNKDKVIVSPYAIEQTFLYETNKWQHHDAVTHQTKNKFCFLFSGHISHAKGIDLLACAVNKLPKEIQSKIVILLAGGNKSDLEQQSKSYNKEIFIPLGFIPNDEMLSVYSLADCFILPTRSDTWALVVSEAVVAGCPVMVSKYAGSAGELIEDGHSGIVFDPLKEDEFIEKLLFCIDNKFTLLKYAANAKTKLAEYNNDVSAQRIVELIESAKGLTANIYT